MTTLLRHRGLLAALLVGAALVAYSNSFSIPLLFDDQNAVVENQSLRSLSTALSGPAQSSTAGRPLVNLSFALNFATGGLEPTGYHAVNLLIHILCALLLFGIVRRTTELTAAAMAPTVELPTPKKGKAKAASAALARHEAQTAVAVPAALTGFFCALLWLLHPLQTEAIDYITQRSESMMALAYLATFYAFVRSLSSDASPSWSWLAIVACLLGALCKESIVTAPVALLLFDTAFFSRSPLEALKKRPVLYGGLLSSWVLLAVMNVSGPRSHSAGFSSGISVSMYLLNQGGVILHYFQRALIPVRLVFDYGVPQPLRVADAWPAVAAVGALFIGSVLAWRFDKRIGFLLTWVFITLAPTSSLIPISTEVGAERRMYLPLVGLVVLAVGTLQWLLKPRQQFVVCSAVAVAFAVLTVQRNTDYHDPMYLWQTVIDRYPHGRAHYGLGMELKAAGRPVESLREMEIAARDFVDAEYALGFELANQGRHQEALGYLRRYVTVKPDDLNVIRAYNLIGRSSLALGRADDAATAFRDTLQRQASNIDAMGGLGDALVRLERFDEAIPVYQSFLRTTTNNPAAYFNYGLALNARGRHSEAADAFRTSVRLNPNDPAAHANLADALARTGDIDGAVAELERVIALEPDPEGRRALGQMIDELRSRR